MACDGDPQAILSLSQHSLLQSENAVSSSFSSASSSQPVDKNQQQWLQGAPYYTHGTVPSSLSSPNTNNTNTNLPSVTSSTFTTQSFNLSQASPNSTSHSSHQLISDSSDASSKYYAHTNISNVISHVVPYSSNRRESNRPTSSLTHFSQAGSNRPSHSNTIMSSMGINFEISSTNQVENANTDGSNNTNTDSAGNNSGIGQYYYYQAQTPYESKGSSMNFYGSRSLVENEGNSTDFVHDDNSNSNRRSHYFDTGQVQSTSQSILGVSSYQHGPSSEVDGLGDKITKSPANSRHQNQPSIDDVMAFSQSVFDPRPKQMSASKSQDQGNVFNTGQSLKITASLNHDILAPVEKRQDMNMVTEFDFSINARDFGPVGSSSGGTNSRSIDYILHNRQTNEEFRLMQDQTSDFIAQDFCHPRYSASSSSSHTQSCSAAVSARKISNAHADFASNQNVENVYSSSSSKTANINENLVSTFTHKDQISALKPPDGHKYSRDYKKMHFLKEESQQSVKDKNGPTVDEKWSGRSRALRKMALLGQGLSCKEKTEKAQDTNISTLSSSSTSYPAFPKKLQDVSGYAAGFQEMPKSQESSKAFTFPDTNIRDPSNSNNLHSMKHVERQVNTAEKPASYDKRVEEASNKGLNSMRDYSLFTTHSATNTASSLPLIPKDTSSLALPSNQQFFATSTSSLDLEFQQSLAHRDLELNPQLVLQVSKDLGMEEGLTDNVSVNPELFSHHVEPHQMTQTNFSFTDNLNPQYSQDISLDTYLNPPEKDNGSLNKKLPYYNQRNLTSETEFNIAEYMEGQVDKDFTQAYFDRTDNVPQDMTMYQKISPEKPATASYPKFRDKEVPSSHNFKASTTNAKNCESSNISELQKELTKTSGKESMKGVRIPRDIHRAMEILQDLQETEKEEEEKRKKELEKQNTEIQNSQNPQQQQQQPKFQPSSTSINSSPKKTFQNKHQIESMAAMTEQQLLSMQTNFIEDQTVENVNFLDQPGYCFPDQSQTAPVGFCDPNMQEMSQYSGFSSLYTPSTTDLDVASASAGKQRDYQQQNTAGYPLNQDIDYHDFKRIAFSATNAKDLDTSNMSSTLQQHTSNVTPWLTGNQLVQQADASDLNFNLGIQRLPEHLNLLNVGPPPSLPSLPSYVSTKFPPNNSNLEEIRGQMQSRCDSSYPDITTDQRALACLDADKFQNFPISSFSGDGSANNVSLPNMDPGLEKGMTFDILEASRQNLYLMMKQEQLCDAVLSTSNVEVKVHQAILCSMSQYLSSRLLPSNQSSIESKPTLTTSSSSSSSSSFQQSSSKNKDGSHFCNPSNQNQAHLIVLVVNCDNIESSSLSAFLMFIYLGKTEFSESNVVDLFILASSLHVLTLKSLCLQFMRQAHISSDGLAIPSVQISKRGMLEMRDQACYTNLGKNHRSEDKAVYACRVPENMDVASQTDQTTSKVGRGGQNEWVMLKKTKQKTVSPSKSKMNLNTKGVLSQENNAQSFKPAKKSWLSPKRRFKSELLAQSKNDAAVVALTKIKDKEDLTDFLDSRKDVGLEIRDAVKDLNEASVSPLVFPDRNVCIDSRPRMILSVDKGVSHESEEAVLENRSVRHIKTTVEIAEEAAAAKLMVSNTNKSFKRRELSANMSHDIQTPTTTIESQSAENLTLISPQLDIDNNLLEKMQNDLNQRENEHFEQFHNVKSSPNISTKEKPVKKKIIQQTLNDSSIDVSATTVLEIPTNTSPKKLELFDSSKSLSSEKYAPDANNGCNYSGEFPSVSEGDLNQVSYFIDSIVNKMGSATEDAELQKVIHDLDSELNRPHASTSIAITSSTVALSSSALSLSMSTSSFSSSSCATTTKTIATISPTSATSSLSTPGTSSTSTKSKSAAQGFRKRFIQLVKSENLIKRSALSPSSSSSAAVTKATADAVAADKSVSQGDNLLIENPLAMGVLPPMLHQHVDESVISQEQVRFEEGFAQTDHQHKCTKETEDEINHSANDKGKGPSDDYDTQFHHKIFKRKRRAKNRKSVVNESDSQTACPKLKVKKGSGFEVDGSLTKARMRRNASMTATTSDSETSVVSMSTKSKGKKTAVNDLTESSGAIKNVRPPPKKRAKMERELLKVTTNNNADTLNKNRVEEIVKGVVNAVDRIEERGNKKGPKPEIVGNVNEKEKNLTGLVENEASPAITKVDKIVGDKKENPEVASTTKTGEANQIQMEIKTAKVMKSKAVNKTKQKRKSPASKSTTETTTAKKLLKLKEQNSANTLDRTSTNADSTKTSKETIRKVLPASNEKLSMPEETSFPPKQPTVAPKESSSSLTETYNIKQVSAPTEILSKETSNSLVKDSEQITQKATLSPKSQESSSTLTSSSLSTRSPSKVHSSSVESQCVVQLQKQFKQSGLKIRIFSCRLCKMHLKSALVSVKHAMIVHKLPADKILESIAVGFAGNQHEACDLCGYVTKDVTYMYMHYHKYFKHNIPLPAGLKTHKCHLCPREFQTSYQLNEHVKAHDEEFTFTCWVCGQSFKSRNSMNNHVFHKHSKQRKHACKVCDKSFKTWTQLKIHVRIHSGDRPFTCLHCDYGSTTLGNMRHHLAHKHKLEKESVEEAMTKISERKTEMTPEALNQLMDLIASKVLPDKAKKFTEDQNSMKKRKKKEIIEENNDKSSGEENMKSKPSEGIMDNVTTISKTDKSTPGSSVKAALREKVQVNKLPIGKVRIENIKNKVTPLSIAHSSSASAPSHHHHPQQDQTTIAIISKPILGNSNIVLIPSNLTGTAKQTDPSNALKPSSHITPETLNGQSVSSSSSSSNAKLKVVSSASPSSLPKPTSKGQDTIPMTITLNPMQNKKDKQLDAVHSETKISKCSGTIDSSQINDNTSSALYQNPENLTTVVDGGASSTQPQLSTPIAVVNGPKVVNVSIQQQQREDEEHLDQQQQQFAITKKEVDETTTTSLTTMTTEATKVLIPSLSAQPLLSVSSSASSSMVSQNTISSTLPIHQALQLNPYIPYNNDHGQTSSIDSNSNTNVKNSSFVYTTGQPIILPNPINSVNVNNGDSIDESTTTANSIGGLAMYQQGFLPAFIMYPCLPNTSQAALIQNQNVSGLMQILPMAATTDAVVGSTTDVPMFQGGPSSMTSVVDTLPVSDVIVAPSENSN